MKLKRFLFRHPSAWIPITFSLTVVAMWIVGIAMFGTPIRQSDEGALAHLFQIWLVLEVLMIAFFATKWLTQKPKEALIVLVIQIALVIAGCSPVFLLGL